MNRRDARQHYEICAAAMADAVRHLETVLRETVVPQMQAGPVDRELDDTRRHLIQLMCRHDEVALNERIAQRSLRAEKQINALLVAERDQALASVKEKIEERFVAEAATAAAIERAETAERDYQLARVGLEKAQGEADAARAGMTILVQERDKALGDLDLMTKGRDALRETNAWQAREIERHMAVQVKLESELKASRSKPVLAPSGRTSPATSPVDTGEEKIVLTETVALIKMLADQGRSDSGILAVVNARRAPPQWLNAAGVAAIREMLG